MDSIETAIAYLSASDEVKEQVDNMPDAATTKQINDLKKAKAACGHGEWLPWLEANCSIKKIQAAKYMRISKELPALSNKQSAVNLDSIETAIAYLSASDEVKERVDNMPDAATTKQINDLKKAKLKKCRNCKTIHA